MTIMIRFMCMFQQHEPKCICYTIKSMMMTDVLVVEDNASRAHNAYNICNNSTLATNLGCNWWKEPRQ